MSLGRLSARDRVRRADQRIVSTDPRQIDRAANEEGTRVIPPRHRSRENVSSLSRHDRSKPSLNGAVDENAVLVGGGVPGAKKAKREAGIPRARRRRRSRREPGGAEGIVYLVCVGGAKSFGGARTTRIRVPRYCESHGEITILNRDALRTPFDRPDPLECARLTRFQLSRRGEEERIPGSPGGRVGPPRSTI